MKTNPPPDLHLRPKLVLYDDVKEGLSAFYRTLRQRGRKAEKIRKKKGESE